MSKTLHAYVLRVDGTEGPVDIDRTKVLDTMQHLVGDGLIEAAPVPNHAIEVWVNEEGKILGLPVNERATRFWHRLWLRAWPSVHVEDLDVLRGDVVLTGDNFKSLPECFKPA